MIKVRDTYRMRLYRAEEVLPKGEEFPTVQQAQFEVDTILDSKWFIARYGIIAVTVHHGGGNRRATYGHDRRQIKLPRWARTRKVILHEIAHAVIGHRHHEGYAKSVAAHGPEFARVFLDLVAHFMGVETARTLRASFRLYRVPVAAWRTMERAEVVADLTLLDRILNGV